MTTSSIWFANITCMSDEKRGILSVITPSPVSLVRSDEDCSSLLLIKRQDPHSDTIYLCLRISLFEDTTERTYKTSIPLVIDKLLGKWIKMKKYLISPFGYHICALALLQPKWNPSTIIMLLTKMQNWIFEVKAAVMSNFALTSYTLQILDVVEPVRWCMFQAPLAWMFVRTLDEGDILYEGDITCPSIDCSLLPTSDPTIYILSFSRNLCSAKDCAKILRQYLKYPEKFYCNSTYQVNIYSRKSVEITTLNLNYVKGYSRPDPTECDLLNRIYAEFF